MDVVDFRVRLRTEHMLGPWNPDDPAPHFSQYIESVQHAARLTPMDHAGRIRHDDQRRRIARRRVRRLHRGQRSPHGGPRVARTTTPSTTSPASIPSTASAATSRSWSGAAQAGFLGVNISPYIWGVPANAAVLYPIYAYCESHNLVAIVHGSLHYNRFQSMWLGDPKYMDEIAIDFPNLKLVISHAGNGFGVLGLAVAQKHPEHLPRVQRPVAEVPSRGDDPGGQHLSEGPLPVRHRLPAGRVRRRRGGLDRRRQAGGEGAVLRQERGEVPVRRAPMRCTSD